MFATLFQYTQHLCFYTDNTNQVQLYPMLLTFNGLPDSKKSKALNKLAPVINNDHNPLGFSHDQFVVHGFGTAKEKQYTHVKPGFPIDSLSSDNGLMNIWDLGVNRTIIPFLYQFCGHISRNHMLLFLDLDRDVHRLHEPPLVHDPLVMNWQSRIQYLFRSSRLSEGNEKKFPCQIFATYSRNNEDENEDGDLHVDEAAKSPLSLRVSLSTLRRECGNVAKQMGVEDLVDIDIILIDMESNEVENLLKDHLQKMFKQLEPQNIPKSWMCFRSSLAQHGSSYINIEELQHEARKFGIKESLEEFCKFFTSFGSILDVRLVDPRSKYIIIKPYEYLLQLQLFFDQMKETSSSELILQGVIRDAELSTFNDADIFLKILRSVGQAARVPNNTIIKDILIPGPAFYVPSVRIGKEETKCTRGAIQLVLGMESSPVNMHTMIIDYLLRQFENSQLILTTSINMATIRITTPNGAFEIEITSQGDVIEFVSRGEEKYGGTYKTICQLIVRCCSRFARKMANQSRDIKYYFAITCEMDRYKEIGYNIYHRRHVLPIDKLCKTCRVKHIDDGQITIWNKILNEVSNISNILFPAFNLVPVEDQ